MATESSRAFGCHGLTTSGIVVHRSWLLGYGQRLGLESVAVVYSGDAFDVVDDAVDHGCDSVAEDLCPAIGLLLVTISDTRSQLAAATWRRGDQEDRRGQSRSGWVIVVLLPLARTSRGVVVCSG
jgi:hypothetical protein